MDKIVLTKEQSEILEKLLQQGYAKEDIIYYQAKRNWVSELTYCLLDLTLDEVCKALYVGYEVEETKEEKLSIIFNRYIENINIDDSHNFYYGYCSGIEKTLEILGIKIKGINE